MASYLLNTVPTTLLGVLVVGLAIALAAGGLLVVRRFFPAMSLRGHNDVAGFIYAVLGVIYAVLLPFVLVVVWEEFRDADHGEMIEADTLAALRLEVQSFPDPARQQVVDQAERYARTVVEDEWPLLSEGKESAAAQRELDALILAVQGIEPGTPRE